jgi:hypothetical protein
VIIQYVIGDSDFERVDVINEHIESIVSKSAKMLGFIKRISRKFNYPYMYKTL